MQLLKRRKRTEDSRESKHRINLRLFLILFGVSMLLVIPLYKISYESIRSRIRNEAQYGAERVCTALDNEAFMLHTIKEKFSSDSRYTMLKTMTEFDTAAQHIILKRFSDFYSDIVNMMQYNSEVFIFFKDNDAVCGKSKVFADIKPLFSQNISINGMDYGSFRNYIFNSNRDMTVKYVEDMELYGERQPSIIIIQPINMHIAVGPEAVVVGIYNVDSLFTRTVSADYRNIYDTITINDNTVYSSGNENMDDFEIVTVGHNVDLRLSMMASEKYCREYMSGFTRFLFLYVILILLITVLMELFLRWYMNRPMQNMLRLVESIIDDAEVKTEKDMLSAIGGLMENKRDNDKALLLMLFLKPLDSSECDFILKKHPDFPQPFLFVIFYDENLTENIIELFLDKYNIEHNIILSPQKGEVVVFFDYSSELSIGELRTALSEMRFDISRKGVDLTAIISIPCDSISDFYYTYGYVRSYYRFVDYMGVFDVSENAASGSFKPETLAVEKLKEAILLGEAFEAKQIVYKQWYELMTCAEISDSNIEKLFYSQMGALAETALKMHYTGELIKYDGKMRINEIAFNIADNIDSLCELAQARKQKNEDYDEVMSFIDNNFTRLNFGIPDVENEFGITGKTINKIVKVCTGKTFTEYVEQHRLHMVQNLLEQTNEEIKNISLKCGFQNYDTFYKFFKKHTGTSPLKWRRTKSVERSYE